MMFHLAFTSSKLAVKTPDMFKANNEYTRKNVTHYSGVSIVNFEQVNADWGVTYHQIIGLVDSILYIK